MAQGDEIKPEDLPMELAITDHDWCAALDRVLPENAPLGSTLRALERHLIARALARSNGVQAKAAELLGISRSLLQYKLKGRERASDISNLE
jgi:two-component system NtrC family response regulator